MLNGRRLRFEQAMADGESIPSVIVRGVREHVLVSTRPVLEAAGVALKHVGHAQLASLPELDRLAFVVRCPSSTLATNAGKRVELQGTSRTVDVRFGPHTIPRSYLELDRRRISPTSLRKENYHRLDWMNLLLPYCPDSLERLTSSCRSCGATLGWRYAKGIGTCEYCGREVAPSLEPALDRPLTRDYRLFAQLASLDPRKVARARASMPSGFDTVATSTMVTLVLQLGGIVQNAHATTTSRVAILQLPKPTLASVAVAGTALLQSWPTGFQTWIAESSERLRTDPTALQDLRSDLQRLSARRRGTDEAAGIIADAVPDLRKHAVHGFAGDRRYYLYKEVQRRLGLDAPQMEALRNWKGIRYERATPSAHLRGKFDAGQIDAMAPSFRTSVPFISCTGALRLPRYGIEQCCRPGVLEREDDPLFMAIKSRTSVRRASLDDLRTNLIDRRSRARRPAGTVSLSVASKRIGGRQKPWGSIVQALVEQRLEYWVEGDEPTAKTMRVAPAAMAIFDHVSDNPREFQVDVSSMINQADSAELLNLKHDHLPGLCKPLELEFAPTGRALLTPLSAVLAVAEKVAWNTEISWHLGVPFRDVEKILLARGIGRWSSIGWCRRHLVREGILPPPH